MPFFKTCRKLSFFSYKLPLAIFWKKMSIFGKLFLKKCTIYVFLKVIPSFVAFIPLSGRSDPHVILCLVSWLWPLTYIFDRVRWFQYFYSQTSFSPQMSDLGQKWVRFAPNGTNPRFFFYRSDPVYFPKSEKLPNLSHLGPICPT